MDSDVTAGSAAQMPPKQVIVERVHGGTVETVTCEKSMAKYFRWAQIKAWTNMGSESVSLLKTLEEEPRRENSNSIFICVH